MGLSDRRRWLAETPTIITRRLVRVTKGYVGPRHLRGSTRRAETSVPNISGRRFPRVGSATDCGVRVVRQHGNPAHESVLQPTAGFASFVSTGTRPTSRGSVTEPTVPWGMTAWERDAPRNLASMTRLRMGAPVTAPQDAPERGTNPVPPTSGERILKPVRQQAGVPRAGEAPSFSTGRTSHP
jgi:hypothetical protein